jgi:hypothetical protein
LQENQIPLVKRKNFSTVIANNPSLSTVNFISNDQFKAKNFQSSSGLNLAMTGNINTDFDSAHLTEDYCKVCFAMRLILYTLLVNDI